MGTLDPEAGWEGGITEVEPSLGFRKVDQGFPGGETKGERIKGTGKPSHPASLKYTNLCKIREKIRNKVGLTVFEI